MVVDSRQFGPLEFDSDSVVLVPDGLIGLEDCRRWILLAERCRDGVAWLQSVEKASLALAVVSPRRFVPEYRIRVSRRELASLGLEDARLAKVLTIVGKRGENLTLNLRAPVLVHPNVGLACQVIAGEEWPVQYELTSAHSVTKQYSA